MILSIVASDKTFCFLLHLNGFATNCNKEQKKHLTNTNDKHKCWSDVEGWNKWRWFGDKLPPENTTELGNQFSTF